MKNIDSTRVKITDGFFFEKQKMLKEVTLDAVYDRFVETHRFEALECKWREGDPNMPHIFWDSDVAKWVEGVAYLLATEKNERWQGIVEGVIDCFIRNQDENGYFNSHFLVTEQDQRFQKRWAHELYCLGHWIEAAVAYFDATGERRFLDAVCRYTDYVERVFCIERSAAFVTPGHPELELALFRLAEATGESRYLELLRFFIDEHGCGKDPDAGNEYNQDAMPLRERESIEGHSVRALYLLSGMIDLAAKTREGALADACRRLFASCTERKMYITGAVGSSRHGEAFSVDYYLPNRTSYAETCASIALMMAASRMQKLEENAKYADVIERVLYNAGLSGVSMRGDSFFYVNPQEIDLDFNNVHRFRKEANDYPITERVAVFSCSCCPPNIVRHLASLSQYALSENDSTLFVNQFMSLTSDLLDIETAYPADGRIVITPRTVGKTLAVRIPAWCKSFTLNCPYTLKNGYAYLSSVEGKIELVLDMPIRYVSANRRVHDDAGRVAVMRGPVVYCAEGVDNALDLQAVVLGENSSGRLVPSEFLLPEITLDARIPKTSEALYIDTDDLEYEQIKLRMIPYYAFANRGSTDLLIWFLK